jgi:hypothetical protein
MRPRECLDLDVGPYDEAYDSGEDDDSEGQNVEGDELDIALDIQEKGLSDEQILKYSVHQKYASKNLLTIFC